MQESWHRPVVYWSFVEGDMTLNGDCSLHGIVVENCENYDA